MIAHATVLIHANPMLGYTQPLYDALQELGTKVIMSDGDGAVAIKQIVRFEPTVVVLDVATVNPKIFEILGDSRVERIMRTTRFVTISASDNIYFETALRKRGVSLQFLLPLDCERAAQAIVTLCSNDALHALAVNPNDMSTDTVINSFLHALSVPANLHGFYFVREAISKCVSSNTIFLSMTKQLYPDVAKVFGSSAIRVERDIRHALTMAWKNGNYLYWHEFFGNIDKKPTNSAFIRNIADTIMTMNNAV